MLLWFVFGVFGIVPEVLKMLVFSQFFGAFVGWFILVYFGFGRFRCFCVSCVCYGFFLCCFCFCFVCFVFVLLLDCFWCCFFTFVLVFLLFLLFFFVLVFFVFVFVFFVLFFGRFKGQVRWPKGPPHLALNPPYFFGFCFFCCFDFFGGFKGQVRWPKGPPHLALNPPYFLFFVFFGFCCFFLCFPFLVFFLIDNKIPVFPLKKGIFVYFSVSPFVSL